VNKAELIEILAGAASGSKSEAARALGAFLEGIRDGLRDGGSVTISGFGTFVVAKRAARTGRDPRTGRAITIPSSRVPRFRASRSLKAAVR
jgi:DNA-binding protein HU-beta